MPLYGNLTVAGAINDLAALLRSLDPIFHSDAYAFCEIPRGAALPPGLHDETIGWFREAEALSVILPTHDARAAGLVVGFEA